nr:MAG: hypothetical protein [Lokiarchaeota virus Skoll Meg22_1214]
MQQMSELLNTGVLEPIHAIKEMTIREKLDEIGLTETLLFAVLINGKRETNLDKTLKPSDSLVIIPAIRGG